MTPMDWLAYLIAALLAPIWALLTPGDKAYWLYALGSVLVASWVLVRAGQRAPLRALFRRDVWGHPSARVDLRFYIVNAMVLTLLVVPLGAAHVGVAWWIQSELALRAGAAPVLLQPGFVLGLTVAVIAALALDFAIYVPHWLQHRVPLLWQFHKVHHSAEVLTPLTAFRFHPVDDVLNVLCIAAIVGTADGALVWLFPYESVVLTIAGVNVVTFLFYALGVHLRHSHVWLAYPRLVSHVLISPAMHQLHHSTNPEHFNKNLGLIFSVWDRAFGTLLIPREKMQLQYGLGEGEEREFSTVRRLYWLPFRKAADLLRRRERPPGASPAP